MTLVLRDVRPSAAARRGAGGGSRSSVRRRDRASIALGRAAGKMSRAAGRGAGDQISGRVMLAGSAGIANRLASDRTVVLVSATNGKSAVTTMLTAVLRAAGHPVVTNRRGANMLPGIVSALAGDLGATHAVLETDEAVLPRAMSELCPSLVVLGELSRDQLDRHHEVQRVAGVWREAFVGSGTRFVAPANDPNVVWALQGRPVDWVELERTSTLDSVVCPHCHALLSRSPATGRWACACGLVQPAAALVQRGAVLRAGCWSADAPLALAGGWQQANRALAVAAARALGVPPDLAFSAVSSVPQVGARVDAVTLPSQASARLVLVKNVAGWSALVDDIVGAADAEPGVLVFVQNDRSADGRDPSWLWDVAFERLVPRRVVASGTRAHDVAVRLHTAGLDVVAVEPDPWRAVAFADSVGSVIIAASYTAYHDIVRRRSGHG